MPYCCLIELCWSVNTIRTSCRHQFSLLQTIYSCLRVCAISAPQVTEWCQIHCVSPSPWAATSSACIHASAWMTYRSSNQKRWYSSPCMLASMHASISAHSWGLSQSFCKTVCNWSVSIFSACHVRQHLSAASVIW